MNRLIAQIQEEIQRQGPIPFARFMELALYASGLGYYERQREIGRGGDFFTSVSVGPLFGELLAFQFAQWLDNHTSDKWQIVEAGAHDGALAADILRWLQKWRPDLFVRLKYFLVEPSPIHREWQDQELRDWLPKIEWLSHVAEAGPSGAFRIIFCNEFLDAMPVHRLAWNAHAKKWEECVVASEGGGFKWDRAAVPPDLLASLPEIGPDLAAVLPAGFILELSPAARAWWKKAAALAAPGILLTIDYGLTGEELFRPERTLGTLRTFSRHHAGSGLLDHPGECDITAHVDFSAIEAAGRAGGLSTKALMGQDQFLTKILALTEASPGKFEPWTPARLRQFRTLTHPDHLGRSFRVLVQSNAPKQALSAEAPLQEPA